MRMGGRGAGRSGVLALAMTAALGAVARPVAAAPTFITPVADDGEARFVLIIGVNRSVDVELPLLNYADDDAARYEELFRSLGARTYLLTRLDENTRNTSSAVIAAAARPPRQAELARAVGALARDVAQARARGRRTLFYFVYAGHGNVADNTAYLALEDAHLDGAGIEHDILDKIQADQSHLIVDACYSYFLASGRGPGGVRHDRHLLPPTEGLARRPDVGLLLSTTSARESHEWEEFQAGIFSHEVRSGLYGAADLDGDGRISYREIGAFINRANAKIPNERFRPRVLAHAPRDESRLVDLRVSAGRRLRVDAAAPEGHYLFEDRLGVRLADFHNGAGHTLSLLLPERSDALYLRRTSDDREFAIPDGVGVVNLADLTPQPPRSVRRGGTPAGYAFNLIFSLPFDDQALANYDLAHPERDFERVLARDAGADGDVAPPPRPRWRTVSGTSTLALAAVSGVAATWLGLSAHGLSQQAHAALSQRETAQLNDRLASRRDWAIASATVAGGAAVTGALLLWLPGRHARPALSPGVDIDGSSGTLGLAGDF